MFFEIYGQALQGRPGTVELLDGIIDAWLEPSATIFTQLGFPDGEAAARLGIAVTRGLLLDLLATGDHDAVDRGDGGPHRRAGGRDARVSQLVSSPNSPWYGRGVTTLDDPIRDALTGPHHAFARAHGSAVRYPADVAAFAATDSFDDLRAIVAPGERIAFFTPEPVVVPDGWTRLGERWIEQMVYAGRSCRSRGARALAPATRTPRDARPGARPRNRARSWLRTHELGRYIGIRSEGGSRRWPASGCSTHDATEISAVCTAPEFRGRGYGRTLMEAMLAHVQADGRTPFLHVKNENGAKALYERLGFHVRREMRLTVFTRAA